VILIPVKNKLNAKQRLAPLLSPEERFQLAQAMLEDVLDAVAAAPERPPVSLVTNDDHARAMAARHGFAIIEDRDDAGETAAIEMATRWCSERGVRWTLVIPGDAPLATADEISQILRAAPEKGTVLASDHKHLGSNAVLRAPAGLFPLRFGDHSYAPHCGAAQATGLPVVELTLPGLALDVDRAEDVHLVMNAPGTTRAQEMLRSWNVGERLRSLAAQT
jgi:2-phospho-L-lactate/phosphoenolpyruvate guanylyltransferase